MLHRHKRAASNFKKDIKETERQLSLIEDSLVELSISLPNTTHPDVPIGNYTNAKIIYQYNTENIKEANVLCTEEKTNSTNSKSEANDIPKQKSSNPNHIEICHRLDLVDFENASKISGEKFAFFKNEAALLELALTNWAMDYLIKHEFVPIITPDIVKNYCLFIEEASGYRGEDNKETHIVAHLK